MTPSHTQVGPLSACILCWSCTWSHSHGVQITMFSCRCMLPLVLKTSLHFFCAHPWALRAGVVLEMSHLGLSAVQSYPPHINLLWVSALITISWGVEELLWWESHHQVLEGDQEDVLIYEYKDKCLEDRLIVWPFSRLIVIGFSLASMAYPAMSSWPVNGIRHEFCLWSGSKPIRKWPVTHITLMPLSNWWACPVRLCAIVAKNGSWLNSMHSVIQNCESDSAEMRLLGEHFLDLSMFQDSRMCVFHNRVSLSSSRRWITKNVGNSP